MFLGGQGISPLRRRASFWTPRKKPKRHQGASAIDRNGYAVPTSMPPAPWTPILRERQLGGLYSLRKGAGGSVDSLFLVFRCRWLGTNRGLGTPLVESAFVAVGLKLCRGGGIKCKPSPLGEGAPVRTLGRMRSIHQNRLCLPPIIETGRPSVPLLRAGVGSSRRATAKVAPAVLRGGV